MTSALNLRFKVLMLGDGTVGKTTFKNRFLTGKFTTGYMATMGTDFASHTMTFQDRTVLMQIWDLAGQKNQAIIRKSFYRGANGALLLYDVTKKQTFINTVNWLKEVMEVLPNKIPILLIANKIDLEQNRAISFEEGMYLSKRMQWKGWQVDYLETSALEGTNITKAFTNLIQLMLNSYENLYVNKKSVRI